MNKIQKEKIKEWEKLATKSKSDWGWYSSHSKKHTKKIFDTLIEFRNDEQYDTYFQLSKEKKNINIQKLTDKINNFPQCAKSIDTDSLIKQKMDEMINMGNKSNKEAEEWRSQNGYRKESSSDYFGKLIKENCTDNDIQKIKDILKEKESDDIYIWNFFKIYYDLEIEQKYRCIVTPESTLKDMQKNPYCDYSFYLQDFVWKMKDNFKDEKKKSEKDTWNKEFLPNQTAKKYYDELITMTGATEIRKNITEKQKQKIEEGFNDWKKLKETEPKKMSNYDPEYIKWRKEYDKIWMFGKYNDEKTNEINIKKVNDEVEEYADSVIDQFVIKNTEKLGRILGKRPDCNTMIPKVGFSSGIIQGIINIKCENGDSFDVWQDLVHVWGGKYGTSFYRYPTTFHDIVYNDQFHKMESEEWMNYNFVKKNVIIY